MAWLQRVRPGGTEIFPVESNCDFSLTAGAFPLFLTKEPNTHTLLPLVFLFLHPLDTQKKCKLLNAAAMYGHETSTLLWVRQ